MRPYGAAPPALLVSVDAERTRARGAGNWLEAADPLAAIHVEEPGNFFPAIETFLAGGWPAAAAAMPSR